jgi:hypothetical protein
MCLFVIRASSDFAETFGSSVATVTVGSAGVAFAVAYQLDNPRAIRRARFEALQLAIATLGGAKNGMLLVLSTLVLLIVIAPSPALATSIPTSNLANPLILPWATVETDVCSGVNVVVVFALYELNQVNQLNHLNDTSGVLP